MCGISFYCSKHEHKKVELENSLLVTRHRGPDSSGSLFFELGSYHIGLGHNRLSILDVSDLGHQPMTVSGGLSISYNGEVYNFEKLRQDLLQKGHEFKSNTDTEVILKTYKEYGESAFKMLNGMFAFILLDKKQNQLYIVRDAVGVKPLYLYEDENNLYGCSEIKGLREFSDVRFDVCEDDLFEFINNAYLNEPSTGFKSIKKLPPGSFLKLDLTTGKKVKKYYTNIYDYQCDVELTELIKRAITGQEVSDVPLGIFFSGGVDSSLLASLSASQKLLFLKYDSDQSSDLDLEYSKLIADFLEKELQVSELSSEGRSVEHVLESIDFVAKNTEELIGDYTFLATYEISKAAAKNKFKVMLSGMGGDEGFAGYNKYIIVKRDKLIKFLRRPLSLIFKYKLYPNSIGKKIERLVSYANEPNWNMAYTRLLGFFTRSEVAGLFENYKKLESRYLSKMDKLLESYTGSLDDKVKVAQHLDLRGFLSHNLTVADKASMLASIELRVPLLDERVLSKGLNTPTKDLINGNKLKFQLKKILLSILPIKLVKRPKTGFNPPLDGIINMIGKERLISELSSLEGYINLETSKSIIDNHFKGKVNNTYKIWLLLYLSRWLKHNRAY